MVWMTGVGGASELHPIMYKKHLQNWDSFKFKSKVKDWTLVNFISENNVAVATWWLSRRYMTGLRTVLVFASREGINPAVGGTTPGGPKEASIATTPYGIQHSR